MMWSQKYNVFGMASRSSDPQGRVKKPRELDAKARQTANANASRVPTDPNNGQIPGQIFAQGQGRQRLPTPLRNPLQAQVQSRAQAIIDQATRPQRPPGLTSAPASDWEQPVVTAPNALRELPVQSLQATLCILSSNVYSGIEVLVDRRLRIGRDPDNDLRLPGDVSMSRHHAVLSPTADCLFIEDLGSTNGTLVNGLPVQRAPLNHNDRVRIGDTLFQVRYEPLRAASQKTPPPAMAQSARSGIGESLRSWRREQGITQTELAGRLGVSQRTVSLWEQGAPISPENLRNLRERGGCDVV
jgi:DNA-binding XRE family transcriptional regulator